MKQIYAIASGCYSDYRVLAVCADEATAKAWVAALEADEDRWHSDARIETLPLLAKSDLPYKVTEHYQSVELWDDGRIEDRGLHSRTEFAITALNGLPPMRPVVRYVRAPCHANKGGRLDVRGDSAEAVRKVVSDRIAMWKAGVWGGPKHAEINE